MIKSENLEGFQKLLIEYYTECAMCGDHPNVSDVNNGWELSTESNKWLQSKLHMNEVWSPIYGIRRKKKTVNINGFDVVPPIVDRLPEIGQKYYFSNLMTIYRVGVYKFNNNDSDKLALRMGWHENKEEAQEYWKARFSDIATSYDK